MLITVQTAISQTQKNILLSIRLIWIQICQVWSIQLMETQDLLAMEKFAGVGKMTMAISRYDLPGCCYYPNSPLCILYQSQLGLLLNDDCDFGTKIVSGIFTSVLHWDNQRFDKTIKHTTSYMPKMVINDDHSLLATFFSVFFFNFLMTILAILS